TPRAIPWSRYVPRSLGPRCSIVSVIRSRADSSMTGRASPLSCTTPQMPHTVFERYPCRITDSIRIRSGQFLARGLVLGRRSACERLADGLPRFPVDQRWMRSRRPVVAADVDRVAEDLLQRTYGPAVTPR